MNDSRLGRAGATARPSFAGEELTLALFSRLAGTVGGYPYVKLVVDRVDSTVHFIDSTDGVLHVKWIARHLLGMSVDELAGRLDAFNDSVYRDPDRRFYLGTLVLHSGRPTHSGQPEPGFLSLETVDVDTMSGDMLRFFYHFVRERLDASVPLLLKPANHLQESHVADIPAREVPRVLSHELYSSAAFVPLNPGSASGRLRVFRSEEEYRAAPEPLEWHDIVVMPRIPEDIPRVSGVIHSEHTAPLSHINVLAAGWRIPNAVRLGVIDQADSAGLDGRWVDYRVDTEAADILLVPTQQPAGTDRSAPWPTDPVTVDEPDLGATEITSLSELRASDHRRFGTKAANLGELNQVLHHGSPRWLGFYRVPRPPRKDLLRYLARQLDLPDTDEGTLACAARRLVKEHAHVPRGIALPLLLQRRFLHSSTQLRDAYARLHRTLRLGATGVEEPCRELQRLIRTTPLPGGLRAQIDQAIARHLSGVSRLVVRSSSNVEDLPGFCAAGLYESVPDLSTPESVLDGVRRVWASLLSPRGVVLRHQSGIPLDHCGMGVIIQEQVAATTGGVLVTCNPLNQQDFRNVYLNVSQRSVADVVSGEEVPLQYLCNTVEGGSRTVSLGSAHSDLDDATKGVLRRLALISRLLQSHFAPDDTCTAPVDIEWAVDGDQIGLLQLRPFKAAA